MHRLMLLALAVGALTSQASAQQRPSLPHDKDPNDWEAYYFAGVEWLGKSANRAEANFAYAAHLRPDRPEPLYGQWLTFWAHDIGRFERYLRDDERTLNDRK